MYKANALGVPASLLLLLSACSDTPSEVGSSATDSTGTAEGESAGPDSGNTSNGGTTSSTPGSGSTGSGGATGGSGSSSSAGTAGTAGTTGGAAVCGDGAVEGAEACDDGSQNSDAVADACRTDCLAATCGDGVIDSGESCDDGGVCDDGTACANRGDCVGIGTGACTPKAGTCAADGAPCDVDGDCSTAMDTCQTDGCDVNCALTVTAGCGNGVVEVGEGCDDGPNNAVDADCLPGCVTATCGDGFVNANGASPEGCDDGNGVLTDACPDGPQGTCQMAVCGDGFAHQGSEGCDDGNMVDNDACSNSCAVAASCGIDSDSNGNPLDPGEACDFGAGVNSDTASGTCASVCRTDCTCPRCGDGVVDYAAGEQCDDGAQNPGDGCDATCMVEAAATCGDGAWDIASGEQCDDGNMSPGDGCDAACQLESVGGMCGDGMTTSPELCDDGSACTDGTDCTADASLCSMLADTTCAPRNGDACNPTCNLGNAVTTFSNWSGKGAMTADTQYLYAIREGAMNLELIRIDIDACTAAIAGGAGGPYAECDDPTTRMCTPGSTDACTLKTLTNGGETLATDGSRLWFMQGREMHELDLTDAAYPTRVVAGSATMGACGGPLDGVGTAAGFLDPRGLHYYNGHVYLLDGALNLLRRFDPQTGSVTTLAGTCGTASPTTNGYGTAAVLGSPRYLTGDNSGNLFFIDTNGQLVRSYSSATGYVDTLAGSTPGYVDASGTMAQLSRPRGIASDGTNLYFGEQHLGGTPVGSTVRQVHVQSGEVTTMVGENSCTGFVAGTGGTGVPPASCAAMPPGGIARLDTPWNQLFHFPTRSLFIMGGNGLRRVQ